jgi:Flp pilus assembly protein TadD
MTVQEALALAWRCLQTGDRAGAGRLQQQIIEAAPDNPDVLRASAGLAQALGDLSSAVSLYRRAIELRPDHAETHLDLGNCLYFQENREEASAAYTRALQLKPDYEQAHTNLGTILQDRGFLDEAVMHHRQALQVNPDFFDAHYNLANALKEMGQNEEAADSYRRALGLRPGFPGAHLNLGMVYLLLGEYEEGWPHYEWRWQCNQPPPRGFPQPLWDGSPLAGKTILLHAEQGLGDTMLFVRYAEMVKQSGGRVVLECSRSLIPLLRSLPGPDELVARGAPLPNFDVHAPLLGLPGIFRTSLATVPARAPYLFADPDLCRYWQGEMDSGDLHPPLVTSVDPKKSRAETPRLGRAFRVGIAWQGDPTYRWDRQRSIPLSSFAPLAGVEGVQLISLQKGPGSEQLAESAGRFPVLDLAPRLDMTTGTFMDTAAVMKNLDLVIAPDTAVTHLAGALGVPAWVPLASNPHWLWMLGRDDSPWYPTLRLFRQQHAGRWDDVFARMVARLGEMVCRKPS